jgi:branched-chain amino acid transport system permease protein
VRSAVARALGLLVVAVALLLAAPAAATAGVPAPAAATAAPSEQPAPAPAPGASPSEVAPAPGGATGDLVRARVRTGEGEDVAGVTISVQQGGDEVVTAETDDAGTAELPLPGPGAYEVLLDVDSLPDDVADLEPRTNPIATTVDPGSPRTVAFRLEPAGTVAPQAGASVGADQVVQLFVNGLRFGLIIAMAAIGISLIFGTTGLTNFAHGELVTFGAMVGFFFNVVTGLPFFLAVALALVLSGAFGYLNDRLLWGPLRRRGTGLIAMMIVSIGLGFLLRYLFLFFFGGSSQAFAAYQAQAGIEIGPVLLRPIDLISMGLSVVVLVVVGLVLVRTQLGKATRAVSDNPALASASGIDVDRVVRTVWVAGAALAGLAGVLLGTSSGITYQMGFQILLLAFAAVTLGGLGTAFGALVGSLIVGVFIELSTIVVPTELKNVGALVILILILLVRPQGILGRAQRVG